MLTCAYLAACGATPVPQQSLAPPIAAPTEPAAPAADPAPVAVAAPDAAPPMLAPFPELEAVDSIVESAIAAHEMPGCAVVVGRTNGDVLRRVYGHRSLLPNESPMTLDTMFDLASVTKVIATTTSVMQLVERGRIQLDDRVAEHIPEFAEGGKRDVTIRHLLTHTAGLPAANSLDEYRDGPAAALSRIFATTARTRPGRRFDYSDLGFITLGALVERVTGQPLDAYATEHVFAPLGMHDTRYRLSWEDRQRAAPTEQRDAGWIVGQVHDPRAYRLGGVAGNAGLFSTADDLALFARAMLGKGRLGDVTILDEQTYDVMTRRQGAPGSSRALGWAVSPGSSPHAYSPSAIGHGGFTGTSVWIDPGNDVFVVFLSNRVHPTGEGGSMGRLAARIGELAVQGAKNAGASHGVLPQPRANGPVAAVHAGIDVLRAHDFSELRGRRVGLVTNASGVCEDGTSSVDLLSRAEGVTLVALFSPEHGLTSDREGRVADRRHAGIPVHSLFGATRKPTPEMLRGVDTLVFDIQDVGSRFYTYASTMRLVMEAAAENHVRFVVLDRPNPLGGARVEGPVLDEGQVSFVNYHRLPVRHGLTMGELAGLLASEREIAVDLTVVRSEGWCRDLWFDETSLEWHAPSPNLPSLAATTLYPAVGLLESTNLAVGRGTRMPFEVVGAPFIDGPRMARELSALSLPGVRFASTRFTPGSSKHRGALCQGVHLEVSDRDTFDPVRVAVEIARYLARANPDDWELASLDRMLASDVMVQAIRRGDSYDSMLPLFTPELEAFKARRERFLLYPACD